MLFPKCLKDVKARSISSLNLKLFTSPCLAVQLVHSLSAISSNTLFTEERAHRKTWGLVLGVEPKAIIKNVAERKIDA